MSDSPVVLVTGCSSGIGRAVVPQLVARGCRVVATARRLEALDGLSSPQVVTLGLDVDDPASITGAVDRVLRSEGRVDVLVNNAGYGQMGPLLSLPPEKLRAQFETNVFGTLELTRRVALAAGGMVERRAGRIVMVSSVVAWVATPFSAPYCASKFALRAFSDVLRVELQPFGVSLVQVEPGPIRSRFSENATAATREALVETGGPYEPARPFVVKRLGASQRRAAPAETAAAVIVEAALSPRPRTRYAVTAQARAMRLLKAVLPDRLFDRIVAREFGLDRPFAPAGK